MVGAAMEAAAEARPPGNCKRGRAAGSPGAGPPEPKRRALATPAPWAVQPQQQSPASRIYRVSRASGGKDRHSKVYTAKGIRDRRVRLSVATAIQFYDLQDRLGYDQPSKAIEWLIKAAADAIDKLPSLDAAAGFPAHPASAAGKERAAAAMLPAAEEDADRGDGETRHNHHQQRTGSGCSSTSETSKGSVLSLSRSDSRVKARERARERSARDKDKGPGAAAAAASAQAASFTELLTGMATAEHKQQQQQQPATSWQQQQLPVAVSAATADYIGFAQPRKGGHAAAPHAFASPAPHLANIAAAPVAMAASSPQHFGLGSGAVTVASGGDTHPHPHAEMTHFSFLQDHFMPVHAAPTSAPAGEYNLNFSMSSGLVGVNTRGTLQSNSQPHISGHHQQLQRLSTALDAPNIPFFFSPAAAAVTTPTTAETQFAAAFQLWNGGFHHHADMKEKGKN